jgi:predicted enzyme involved in methoxymalonyl-ACP biosynthesis
MIDLKKIKINKLIGIFKKTEKNSQCSDFYKKLNFKKISKEKFSINLSKLNILPKKIMQINYE